MYMLFVGLAGGFPAALARNERSYAWSTVNKFYFIERSSHFDSFLLASSRSGTLIESKSSLDKGKPLRCGWREIHCACFQSFKEEVHVRVMLKLY